MDIDDALNEGITTLNGLERKIAAVVLRKCCSSSAWVEEMVVNRPYQNFQSVRQAAIISNNDMSMSDWQEGFSGCHDFSNNDRSIHRLQDAYFDKFGVPFIVDEDGVENVNAANSSTTTKSSSTLSSLSNSLESALVLALASGNIEEQRTQARTRFMKTCIRKLANVLVSLGDPSKPVGFHQARIEKSLLQMDDVPKLDVHPSRAEFWNGTRLKGLLEHEYKEKDVELWGGLNYQKKLPKKINHVNHFEKGNAAVERISSTVVSPKARPIDTRRFFGGTFR